MNPKDQWTIRPYVTKVCLKFTDSIQSMGHNVNLMIHAPTLNLREDED